MKFQRLRFAIDSQDQALGAGELVEYVCQSNELTRAVLDSTANESVATIASRIDFPSGENLGMLTSVRLAGDALRLSIFNATDAEMILNAAVLTVDIFTHDNVTSVALATSDSGTIFGPFITLP